MDLKEYLKAWFKWLAYEPQEMPKIGPKIVAIGGGTGLARLLEGLKNHTYNLSAIVTVYDSGGSTGRLRKEFNVPALGDIRNCLVALAEKEEAMRHIFDYRFGKGKGLIGHSLGNLLLTAIFKMSRNLQEATEAASSILKIKGKVIPASLGNAHLWAELENNKKIEGEANIPEKVVKLRSNINKIWLEPKQSASPLALRQIKKADLILIGPGSLFTSVLPNFLVSGIKEAVNITQAKVIYIANISQERGETMDFSIEDHIDKLLDSGVMIDICLVNNQILKKTKRIADLGEIENITTAKREYRGVKIKKANLIDVKSPLYHNPEKLASAILKLDGIEKK